MWAALSHPKRTTMKTNRSPRTRLNSTYLYATVFLFLIEVFIALFVRTPFIRGFVGDVLVIVLIYCFVRSFWRVPVTGAIATIFLFACLVELLQWFQIVDRLGLRDNALLSTVIGTTFDWKDILAYGVGCAIVFLGEQGRRISGKSWGR
jgi:hypothetical protein